MLPLYNRIISNREIVCCKKIHSVGRGACVMLRGWHRRWHRCRAHFADIVEALPGYVEQDDFVDESTRFIDFGTQSVTRRTLRSKALHVSTQQRNPQINFFFIYKEQTRPARHAVAKNLKDRLKIQTTLSGNNKIQFLVCLDLSQIFINIFK